MASELEITLQILTGQVSDRLVELILAPVNKPDMLWTVIPLVIATFFITLYFGRYRKEELGWNTAFGNTMVFMFVALNILREMYGQGGDSFGGLFEGGLYTMITLGLIGGSLFLMFITYFHLLPKRFAFFLFSAPPINVSVYAVMAVVYANVPPDYITALAAIAFLVIILIIARILKFVVSAFGLEYIPGFEEVEIPEEIARKLRDVEVAEPVDLEDEEKPKKKQKGA